MTKCARCGKNLALVGRSHLCVTIDASANAPIVTTADPNVTRKGGRARVHASNAARQKAYRERLKAVG